MMGMLKQYWVCRPFISDGVVRAQSVSKEGAQDHTEEVVMGRWWGWALKHWPLGKLPKGKTVRTGTHTQGKEKPPERGPKETLRGGERRKRKGERRRKLSRERLGKRESHRD